MGIRKYPLFIKEHSLSVLWSFRSGLAIEPKQRSTETVIAVSAICHLQLSVVQFDTGQTRIGHYQSTLLHPQRSSVSRQQCTQREQAQSIFFPAMIESTWKGERCVIKHFHCNQPYHCNECILKIGLLVLFKDCLPKFSWLNFVLQPLIVHSKNWHGQIPAKHSSLSHNIRLSCCSYFDHNITESTWRSGLG